MGMQGQVLQQNLSRMTPEGCIEPLLLEDGKAALLNVCGPFLLQRQHLANLPLKAYTNLVKVRPWSASFPWLTAYVELSDEGGP